MTRRSATVLLALLTFAAGCSDDETGRKPGPLPADPAASDALATAVRAYSAAFLGGDGGAAYDMLSGRCKERLPRVTFVQMVDVAKAQFGPLPVQSLTVDQVAGDLGRVTYTFSKAELDQRGEPWVREAGAWKVDDC
jgi:hypothetical protein